MRRRPPSLEERVERLERMVAEIHAHLGLPPQSAEPPPSPAPARGAPAGRRAEAWALRSEQWLGRVGLGLLFLGLVYLFNYSIEQGWITPGVRVGVGVAIATTLLLLGLRARERHPSYSQILLAGAIAVYYVSGFAAFQLYALVGVGTAFAYMTAVMVLAFWLARREDRPALAGLGAAGGFAILLLLRGGGEAVLEIAVYSALVVGWTGLLYWLRGWASLLWTYAVGGLAALGIAAHHAEAGERGVVQAALALTWALGAALPFVRGVAARDGARRAAWGIVPMSLQLRALGVGATTTTLLLTDRMWALGDSQTGGLFLLAAALYAAFAVYGTRTPNAVARAAAPVAAALCAAGTFLLVDGAAARVLVLALEAAFFVYGGSRRRFAGLEWVGHSLFALLSLSLAAEALAPRRVAFDSLAWAQLAMLLLALGVSACVPPPGARVYRLGAHALFLAWLAKELGPLSEGTGIVTLAWGVYGAALLIAALQWRDRRAALTHGLQLVALSTLGLAVLKLLLVDLGRLATVWRILLFMGFGAALLGLGSLFRPRSPRERGTPAGEESQDAEASARKR